MDFLNERINTPANMYNCFSMGKYILIPKQNKFSWTLKRQVFH